MLQISFCNIYPPGFIVFSEWFHWYSLSGVSTDGPLWIVKQVIFCQLGLNCLQYQAKYFTLTSSVNFNFGKDEATIVVLSNHLAKATEKLEIDADNFGARDEDWALGVFDGGGNQNGISTDPTLRLVVTVDWETLNEDFLAAVRKVSVKQTISKACSEKKLISSRRCVWGYCHFCSIPLVIQVWY